MKWRAEECDDDEDEMPADLIDGRDDDEDAEASPQSHPSGSEP